MHKIPKNKIKDLNYHSGGVGQLHKFEIHVKPAVALHWELLEQLPKVCLYVAIKSKF